MRKITSLLSILITTSIMAKYACAEFNDLGCGARPLAMGNAFIALADDINAIYYNPSGLVRLKRNEFTSSYGRLYVGLDDNSNLGWGVVGYAQPLGTIGTIGLGYINFTLLDCYSENTMLFSYGRWLTGRMAMGFNVKLLRQKIFQDNYTAIDPVFKYGARDTVQAVGMDVGYIFNFSENISFGAVLSDINRPDMGFMNASRLPVMVKTGLSYRDERISTALDFAYKDACVKIYAGGESWLLKRSLAVRTGLAMGSNEYRNFTAGFGYNFNSLQFDYAFLFPIFGINEIYGSHRISMILRFGAWPSNLKPADELVPKDATILSLREKTKELKLEHEKKTREIIMKHNFEVEELKKKIAVYEELRKDTTVNAVKQSKEITEHEEKPLEEKRNTVGAAKPLEDAVKTEEPGKQLKETIKTKEPEKPAVKKTVPVKKKPVQAAEEQVEKTLPVEKKSAAASTMEVKSDPASPAEKEVSTEKEVPAVSVKKSGKRAHRVVQGETLKDLAVKYYGDPDKWKIIYRANMDKVERGKPKIGSLLVIP